jgi:hypothetical protein
MKEGFEEQTLRSFTSISLASKEAALARTYTPSEFNACTPEPV